MFLSREQWGALDTDEVADFLVVWRADGKARDQRQQQQGNGGR